MLMRRLFAAKTHREQFADTRTPEQIAQAACTRPDGTWQCNQAIPHAKKMAASGVGKPPPSWGVPYWAFDPANVTTCASDGNTCTSRTCGTAGVGPCSTYGQITQRWGTICPTIFAPTQVEMLSGHSTSLDPMQVCAFGASPAYLEVFAAVPATCTATLSNVTPKNRATGQLLRAQAGACFGGADLMVTDVTHPAVAWTHKNVSGAIYSLTQPADNNSYASVDSWQLGDTVTVGTPFQANVRNLGSPGAAEVIGFGFNVWVHDLTLWAPDGLDNTITASGGILYMDEVRVQGGEFYTQGAASTECDNCDFMDGTELNIPGGIGTEAAAVELWGVHRTGINKFGNAILGGDIILAGGIHYVAGAHVGSVYIESAATLVIRSDTEMLGNFEGVPTGSAILWGPGTVQSVNSSKLSYPSPATNVFLNAGGLSFDTTTTGCAFDTSVDPAIWHCNRNLTAALLSTSVAGGGFNECAWSPHGARFCVP